MKADKYLLLASALMVAGCSTAPPRNAVMAEQRRIEGAVRPGTSAQEVREALVSLGYTCREINAGSGGGAARNSATTDCAKAIQDKTELHICLTRDESRVKDISYELRPCGS